jgi:uncharacterized protein with NRDE domain
MCTILLAWRHLPGAPLVLAANRDEFRARPTLPPHVLRSEPRIAGGQDALAGGTWLAVRRDGVVAAVTNRVAAQRDPTRRSRGELPLALLDARTDAAAESYLQRLDAGSYNPFNALYVSPRLALVAQAHGDQLELRRLEPGLHVLTVHDLDDRGQAKVAFLADRLAAIRATTPAELGEAMESLLTDHGEPGREGVDAACVHGELYGTLSSSSVCVEASGAVVYRHAPGPPCTTSHMDLSDLLNAPAAQAPASG